jgi:hypothetical protein
MFGYNEPLYDVEQTFETRKDGKHVVMQVRSAVPLCEGGQPSAGLLTRYIAVVISDSVGTVTGDFLFFYLPEEEALLVADWEQMLGTASVSVKDMQCFERILGHSTGLRRDGGVCMY